MASNEEEDDYMSDKFIESSKDVRPSLIFKHSQKRSLELEKKVNDKNKKFATQSRHIVEAELREEGLGRKLGNDNKGFALMQKMGYKPGSSLGKDGSNGRVEPISVNLKAGRAGLGREEFLKQKREEIAQMKSKMFERRKTAVTLNEDLFKKQQQQKMTEKQVLRDLYNCQKSCMQLDQSMDLPEATEIWFWPEEKQPKDDDESDDEEDVIDLEPFEKLEILNEYLRKTHNFCTWCGVAYNDEDDLSSNCPGNTAEDH